MTYLYQCRECGEKRESIFREDVQSCPCGGLSKRKYVVNVGRGFIPHFNHSVGKYVNNERQFLDELKRGSDATSQQTGTDCNYVPVYPQDIPPTKDTEILETRAKILHDQGTPDAVSI